MKTLGPYAESAETVSALRDISKMDSGAGVF